MFLDTNFLKNDEINLSLIRTAEGNADKKWVPAYYFEICLQNGTVIGNCDLRIGYNESIYYGGNIGYYIDPNYRGHHYAAKACKLMFKLAKKHHMDHIIITCNPDNFPSRKTCEYAGGNLETVAKLPEDNDMRLVGETEKCIYRFQLI